MRLLQEIRSLAGNYHVKSGMYHYYRSEFKQAEEFLRKALKDDETLSAADRRNARYYLTMALMDAAERAHAAGNLDAGVELLGRAAEVSPRYPDLHYRMGLLLESLDRGEEAIAAYLESLACHQDYVEAKTALGFCLLRAGRMEEAREALAEALELKKKRMDRPFLHGVELVEQGKPEEAADYFHEALLASPQLCDEYLSKAREWLKAEEYEKALTEFDRALTIKPKYPDLHNYRGVVLCGLDRLDEAIEAFRQSAALSPRFLVPRLNLAFALMRAEEYKQAEVELESVLELDPTEPVATTKLEELRTGRLPEKRRRVSRGNAR